MPAHGYDTYDEDQLIALVKTGDHEAFSVIVKTYKERVFNTALRFLKNYAIAEELTQDVFITVYEKIGDFKGESKFSTWLYRVTINHAKNRIGYLSRRAYFKNEELSDYIKVDTTRMTTRPRSNPSDHLEEKQLIEILHRQLLKLKNRDREIIILKDFEDHSYEEIARILRIELGTVKSRLSRARRNLKDLMKDYI